LRLERNNTSQRARRIKSQEKGADMSELETKQILIDNYTNLLRIKAAETAENRELDIQLEVVKIKLTSYSIDTAGIERMILG
jgi:hypothetical protein